MRADDAETPFMAPGGRGYASAEELALELVRAFSALAADSDGT